MRKWNVLVGLTGYLVLVFILEGQLELLRKIASANFDTQRFLWARSFVDLLEASGLLGLTLFVARAEKNRLIAWIFVIVGLLITFYAPVSALTPALPTRLMPIVLSSEFVGAYVALLGMYLLITNRDRI